MGIVGRLLGDTSLKNVLLNLALWVVMALGVLAALANTGSRRTVAIAIVVVAFVFLTLHNTNVLARKRKDEEGRR